MGLNNLELARDSLFIEKTTQLFTAADAAPLRRAHTFSRERANADDQTPFEAACLLLGRNTDAVMVAATLPASLLRHDPADPEKSRKRSGRALAPALENIDLQAILAITDRLSPGGGADSVVYAGTAVIADIAGMRLSHPRSPP
ncbi:MAG: hypothetical protein A4E57_03826 [Syntrophorhabdaceae bacterium PtaU1.Bin034]|nr:MAG: hypothetical protein A4E57_03826 [Syntrophorhabdaceae bacterium PtaU1.Bin034]